ncbi:hypothetical protein DICTH_0244 [Dictyoglomus thermophilum H-6-12]|uniref:Uncharacterized protein n=1 Tax=Dictyoglomus thermophilum (strain ATCC 35947 / DSM 3960 / H-6-12) TaxID=309799 RepID=B5YC18_DICT6|nr:hypothetical protein DICTH_0244 [Dictyoglomus thermophilum H-6-12]
MKKIRELMTSFEISRLNELKGIFSTLFIFLIMKLLDV